MSREGRKIVLVWGEIEKNEIGMTTLELLNVAQALVRALDGEVHVIFVNPKTEKELCGQAIFFGADTVHVFDMPGRSDLTWETCVAIVQNLVREVSASILLFPHTLTGSQVACQVGFSFGFPVVLDCVQIEIEESSGNLVVTRPVYGGKCYGIYTLLSESAAITLHPKSVSPARKEESKKGKVFFREIREDILQTKVRLVDVIPFEFSGPKLEDADVVVCGGRGIGGTEGFEQLKELALALGNGAVGATRAAVNEGWASQEKLIGISGKTVAPKLYIGVALSGACQHIIGMKGSKIVVAVNKDPEAPIFRFAHYGVVEDYKRFLPAFLQTIRSRPEKGGENDGR